MNRPSLPRRVLVWLDKNARYFGVFSAVITLLCLLISNTVGKWADDQDKATKAVQDERAAYRQQDNVNLALRNIEKALTRIESRVPEPPDVEVSQAKRDLVYWTTQLDFFRIHQQDVSDLLDYATRLKSSSDRFTARFDVPIDALTAKTRDHDVKLGVLRKEVDDQIVGSGISLTEISDDEARRKTAQCVEAHSKLSRLGRSYSPLVNEALAISARIEAASADAYRRWHLASVLLIVSTFVLTAIGSALGIYGMVHEEKTKEAKAASAAAFNARLLRSMNRLKRATRARQE